MKRSVTFVLVGFCAAAAFPTGISAQRVQRIRIATAAPQGSIWHQVLQQLEQDWERISDGGLDVVVFPGNQGDEATMLAKVRAGSLQGAALSGAGLSMADDSVAALLIPMMYSSYEELDYVWERLAPELESRLEGEGFVVLNWADVGWVYFFTKESARTPNDIRGMRLFTSAGDPDTERLYRDLGLQPVPMAVTDMTTNLLTGLIEAFLAPPLFAIADQSFAQAPHMIDLKFAPLIGATLITTETWEQVSAELRPRLRTAARQAAEYRRGEIRALGDTSIMAMIDAMGEVGNGTRNQPFQVMAVDADLEALWRREVEAAWPEMRGRMVPEDLFDEALRLRDEYRSLSSPVSVETR